MLNELNEGAVGRAFGDAMSMNVLMRVLPRALRSAGYIQQLPPDRWADIPKIGRLPDAVYRLDDPSAFPRPLPTWT